MTNKKGKTQGKIIGILCQKKNNKRGMIFMEHIFQISYFILSAKGERLEKKILFRNEEEVQKFMKEYNFCTCGCAAASTNCFKNFCFVPLKAIPAEFYYK